jgi:transmembrane sensor
MPNQEANELLNKYREGKATKEEIILLLNSIRDFELDFNDEFSLAELESIREEMRMHLPIHHIKPIKRIWPRIAAAASIVLCLSIGSYFLFQKQDHIKVAGRVLVHDLEPGSNKAVLTIGNGQKIVLTGAHNGRLAVQGNMIVHKTSDGQVVYQADQNPGDGLSDVIYNTMSTPRGGKYDLVLSDGTKVWLDAASSITYPTTFSKDSREVSMTGQAYFEVAHYAAKPFRVTVNGQTVEVLGTHFNINAYEDELSTRTTLLEGRVKVSKGNESAILNPGQQSLITTAVPNRINVKEAHIEEATAWKDGHFHFEADNIQSVMRQMARWYDVDIEYNGAIPVRSFSGDIDRNSKASVALKILSISRVHFKIDGKKIIVTP